MVFSRGDESIGGFYERVSIPLLAAVRFVIEFGTKQTVRVPPIKCQGIKTRLVPWIRACVRWNGQGRWIEPFMGSGVVGFNLQPASALFCDSNPHIVDFYNAVADGAVTAASARAFLEAEGRKLARRGADHYYELRDRFNRHHDPLDFLFLNRACFNGLIRFNSSGGFNTPFGRKPQRFSKAYITKIVNQVDGVAKLLKTKDWSFCRQDYRLTLASVGAGDFVYCDPPYAGRHADYFNGWNQQDESALSGLLAGCPGRFALSTWHSNPHRLNDNLELLWSGFKILTREHFYHVGGREANRKPMLEALVINYEI